MASESTTFTVTVNGTYGPCATTVPVECPDAKKLRALGQYQLGAYATRYPLAAEVLEDKRAQEAAYEAAAAERDAAKAAKAATCKGKHGTPPDTGNSPLAVDGAKANTAPATTVGCTTLETATDAELIAELLSRQTTMKGLQDVALAFDAALLDAENALETVPTVKPIPVTPKADTRKAADRESVAAHTVKPDAAKLTPSAPQEKPAPTWTDATLPKTHKAVVALGKDGVASLATWLGVGTVGMNFANAVGAVWAALKAAEPTKAAPKAKANAAPKADATNPATQETAKAKAKAKHVPKADDADPVVPGLFDAAGKPVTLSRVKAALEAYAAMATKKAA
jgi:hypothetical protein